MPNQKFGSDWIGPDEGQYDLRRGASAYASIISTFGSLVVTAIVVVFTVPSDVPENLVTLCTGLLAVAFMGSLVGAFGMAAIASERDPTANLAAALLFVGTPVGISVIAILGAFQVLAYIYVPGSAYLFVLITATGGGIAIVFNSFTVADAFSLHPRTMEKDDFDAWINRQWLKSRQEAVKKSDRIALCSLAPLALASTLRLFGVSLPSSHWFIHTFIVVSVVLIVAGTILSLLTTNHPELGNEQKAVRKEQAWPPNLALGLYAALTILVLP